MNKVIPVILLNGPPRSGKDTLAKMLERSADKTTGAVVHFKFAYPLKQAAHTLLGIPHAGIECFHDVKNERGLPGLPNNVTPRELYIAMSETLAKPLFGKDFFGHAMWQSIRRCLQNAEWKLDLGSVGAFVISDCGFAEEVAALLEHVPHIENEFDVTLLPMLVELHREGCTFEGDSRSYIGMSMCSDFMLQEFWMLKNDGTEEHMFSKFTSYLYQLDPVVEDLAMNLEENFSKL